MLFNSISFAIFLPIVFILHWFVAKNNQKQQNILLLLASYFFYGCWNWKFLFLLIFSTLLDYFTGIKMCEAESPKAKKFWFWLSISVNLSFLGIFKYYNFFAKSFTEAIANFNIHLEPKLIDVILPVGISFYTFHGLSYVIDIYKGRMKAERNFIDYSLFVSFFPLLVAGPIERASHLLPQIQQKRKFEYSNAINGLKQILWGLVKKIVIADQCAKYATMAFTNVDTLSGSSLLFGAIFFTFQIYGDFSGYSDIALGTARLFGVELLRNFAFPYFSRDIAEFWRRWHISLSTWFRDYLYIPLGGSKVPTWKKVRNTFIIFLVSGFWHGANWTFIIWGALNALFIMPSIIFSTNRNNLLIVAQGKILPTFKELLSMGITFLLIVFSWIFFRADNISQALSILSKIFSRSLFTTPKVTNINLSILIALMMILEWIGREEQFAISKIGVNWPLPLRWAAYMLLLIVIVTNISLANQQQFIYFQF